jgi:hypothetical protein
LGILEGKTRRNVHPLPFIHKYYTMSETENPLGGRYGNIRYGRAFSGQASGKKGAKLFSFICGKARIVMQKTDK